MFVAVLAWPMAVLADLDGKWRQGPLKEEFTIQQWSKTACGAPPESGSRGGGETVTVAVEGDLLSIVGGGRVYKSNQCYDDMPTLRRDSYQRDPSGKIWRTHCSTPPNDPRRGNVNTLVQVVSDGHIEIAETGRYEITHQQGSCVADVKRTRSLDKIIEGPIATTAPAQTAPPRCASPGEPARLEVRPSKKLLRSGESFTFSAIVLDGSGCATSTPTEWKIEGDARGLTVDAHGKVTAPNEGEGSVTIVVTAAGKSTRVTVDLTTAAKYDDLLKSSGLNAAGETDTASIVVIAEGSIGSTDVRAETSAKRKKTIFLSVIGGLVVVIGFVGFLGWRRSKRAAELQKRAEERHAEKVREIEERKREKAERHAAQLRAHEESLRKRAEAASMPAPKPGTICPACQREFPPDGAYCPHDGNRLVPINVGSTTLGPGGICPTCKRGYDPGVRTCPDDGAELVPHAAFIAKQPESGRTKQGKICPTCGQRFHGDAAFCGKDGTALVLLN